MKLECLDNQSDALVNRMAAFRDVPQRVLNERISFRVPILHLGHALSYILCRDRNFGETGDRDGNGLLRFCERQAQLHGQGFWILRLFRGGFA